MLLLRLGTSPHASISSGAIAAILLADQSLGVRKIEVTGDSFGEASEIHEQEGWFGCVFDVHVGKLIVFRNSGIVFIMGV